MSADRKSHGRPAAIIVGAGLMGRHHSKAAAAAGARIVAIVDRNRDAAEALAGSWPGAAAESDLDQALAATNADVVHICTPLRTHTAFATAVATTGLHALVEKPIAATAAEAGRIHADFARAGKLVCPVHQYAFQRSIADALAWLARAGAVRQVAFDICSAGAAGGLDPDEVVADILPHPLSLLQKLLPDVDLAALEWTCARPARGEWLVTAATGGAVLLMQISMSGRPTRFVTRVTGQTSSIELDNFHDFAVTLPGSVSRGAKIVQPFLRGGLGLAAAGWNLAARTLRRESAYPGLKTLVGDFYQAVRTGGPPPITPPESIAVAEARDRIVALAHG